MKDVPLPEPVEISFGGRHIAMSNWPLVTLDQCKAYGDARVRAALEEAIECVRAEGTPGDSVRLEDAIRKLMA